MCAGHAVGITFYGNSYTLRRIVVNIDVSEQFKKIFSHTCNKRTGYITNVMRQTAFKHATRFIVDKLLLVLCRVAAVKVSPYIIIVQVIFYYLWDHWAHPGYFENGILFKPALGGRMQPIKLQCCIWRDSFKPSLRFSCFLVFFVSKGNPFWL